MIYGYGLEYAEKFIKANKKLSMQAQNEVKELLMVEMINKLCGKFIEAKTSNNKTQAYEISKKMSIM